MQTSLTISPLIPLSSSRYPRLLFHLPPHLRPSQLPWRSPSSFHPVAGPWVLNRRRPKPRTRRKRRSSNLEAKVLAVVASYRSGRDEPDGALTEAIDREVALRRDSRNCSAPTRHQQIMGNEKSAREDEGKSLSHCSHFFHKKTYMKNIKLFGVEMSSDNVAVAMVYFVQGVLGLSRLAVSFYFKDDLHLDPAEVAFITGSSALPWLIKPLYGFISDSYPLFGYRRRSYLVLSGFLGALSWGLMATLVNNKYTAAFCILLGSLSVAFSDVVVDSMVVERARGETQSTSGSLQSLCWGSSAFGGIVSAYFSGSLVDTYGTRFVFGVTAFLPLMTSAVALLVKEKAIQDLKSGPDFSDNNSSFAQCTTQQVMQLWDTVRQPDILLPTLFIFLWQATPQSDSAMFFFTTNKLGFTPEFLGRVKLVTSIASLVGVALYNGFLKNIPLRKIFLWTTIAGSGLGMTQVLLVTGINRHFGVSDEWFAIGDSLILTVLGQKFGVDKGNFMRFLFSGWLLDKPYPVHAWIDVFVFLDLLLIRSYISIASFMPVLVLAARLCPPGVEATLFATLMSISNGGSVTGGLIGAGLTQVFGITKDSFTNLPLLIILCNLSSLLPLPLLGLLPKENSDRSSVVDPESALQSMEEMKLK